MDCRSDRFTLFLTALVLGTSLALVPACHRKEAPQSSQSSQSSHHSIDSLRGALERAANQSLPTPSLTSHHFELKAPASALANKAAEVANIGKNLQGTVISEPTSPEGGQLLINLPANQTPEFARRIGIPETAIPPADSSDQPVLIEVRITPPTE